jgi:hypothetical protein
MESKIIGKIMKIFLLIFSTGLLIFSTMYNFDIGTIIVSILMIVFVITIHLEKKNK